MANITNISIMTSQKQVSIIVAALLPSFGIGYKNSLPWRLRQEMKYFKTVTTTSISPNHKNAVIMGRKTWESIPEKFRPLPDRYNVVLTKQTLSSLKKVDGVKYANDLDVIIHELLKDDKVGKILIIGGCEIYNNCLRNGLVDNLLITEINHVGEGQVEMDTFLDKEYILNNFDKTSGAELQRFIGDGVKINDDYVKEGDFEYQYTLYRRK